MGAVEYAPEEVQLYGKMIRLWGLVLKRLKGCKVGYRTVFSLAMTLDKENPMQFTMEEVTEFRAEAWKKYNTEKPWARVKRIGWLRGRRDKYVEDGFMEEAKKLDRQILEEETKGAHKKLAYVRDKVSKGGTSKLTVPEYEGSRTMIEVTDKEEMENILSREYTVGMWTPV